MRRETAEIYNKAGEHDRAASEIAEAKVIEAYLPKALTSSEVEQIVQGVVEDLKADGLERPGLPVGVGADPLTRHEHRSLLGLDGAGREAPHREAARRHSRVDRLIKGGTNG
ncbi:GatB/YqeY domain-containing protein [Arthrobacter sp.]|uniref:GatB/YqeY domain-containing protein n=1 Tax=Arthrobacter sp. TaxID=1667 RepID=UPI002810C936|nr:GatB/YqeY domain-containing protein [Arthrobacter sp.]